MNHSDTIRLFFDYADGTLDAALRTRIDGHLASCDRCRKTYAMLAANAAPNSQAPIRLTADPFLPTRIRAMAAPQPRSRWMSAVRASAATFALGVAVMLGVYLGSGLTSSAASVTSTELAGELASSLNTSDLSDGWLAVVETNEGQAQ